MDILRNAILIVSMFFLFSSFISVVFQLLKEGLRGLRFFPSGIFFSIYVVTFAVWIFL